ncbi:MAG TPA: SGNH hydrolase domain-containing protein [Acidimicrobiales bacterium]
MSQNTSISRTQAKNPLRGDTQGLRGLAEAVLLSALSPSGFANLLRHTKVFVQKSCRALVPGPLAVALVVTTIALATPTSAVAASTPSANVSVETAVANAVAAAQANAPVPTNTIPSLSVASTDHVYLGDCDAYNTPSWHVCQYGDAKGAKTVVVMGNSHASMWVPALSVAAKADNWQFYPLVHEACGFEQMVNLNNHYDAKNHCALWYDRAISIIKRLHPDVIVVGTYTGSSKWAQGEPVMLNQLKQLTKKVIVLSDTPKIPSPPTCLLQTGATQKSCLWPLSKTRAGYTVRTSNIATSTGSKFIDVTPWFCDDNLCPSLINNMVPFFDGAHLTPQYSKYLGTALRKALNLNGANVIAPQSVSVPVTTTTVPTGTTQG